MDNNIKLIDQRLSQLRAFIPRFREHSTAAENRLANEIITWELKRIQAIHALEKKLGDLRNLIPLYKARFPANEHELTDQIINVEIQLISAKSQQPLPHQSAPHHLTLQQPASQETQSNDMITISSDHHQKIPNVY